MSRENKILILLLMFLLSFFCTRLIFAGEPSKESRKKGAFYTGKYPNLFKKLLNKKDSEINDKIGKAFQQFFYGNDETERIYYSVEPDMAYITDINNNDVRTEGMSYGMMISVQMNKKNEFDRLWKWAKTYMQHQTKKREGYFAWHCRTDGSKIDSNSASDGEVWFVTSLFFASARWGDGEGIYNYKKEAQHILDAMLNKIESSNVRGEVTNMFNKKAKQVVFVPSGEADDFTDPSYHVPHYYQLWARWADKENQFWRDVADTSRAFLKRAVHPVTGLAPDYSLFDGTPFRFGNGTQHNFQYDAWRVAMNVALDYTWFAKDKWAVMQSNRLLNFFHSIGVKKFGQVYTLDGKQLVDDHSAGIISMNAVAALASTNDNRKEFVQEIWDVELPTGRYRYYDGILYMMAMLQLSGNFRVWHVK
ncbi:MAG: oligosaccharide reducing-end xylanase [Ignavibacteria bacterium]|nr:MAG: oligosaccharide reducing-end xylanase [Ignavibacteria bacterium]KAF0160860.1 MAG: oligosaccharide reducing-end xylanase [Ignavibacteria bacterium]